MSEKETIQLKERYKTLSEIEDFFPSTSRHKAFVHIDTEMRKVIKKLAE
tara:strand:+ start:23663 stop:23809 length:147 start_codon:yes stop_codon:yes gene_type:complete